MKRFLRATAFAMVVAAAATELYAICPDRLEYVDGDGTRRSCMLREDSYNNFCLYDCKVVSR
jgi:hypothetical protein